MSLQNAAEAMLSELRELSKWEQELISDLAATRGRSHELRNSLMSLTRCLPRREKISLRADLARLELPLVRKRREVAVMTNKVRAVHNFLAAADDTVTTAEVQAHLVAEGLADRPGAASIILSRKVQQRMLERLGRGRYRVNPNHPEIAARRVLEG